MDVNSPARLARPSTLIQLLQRCLPLLPGCYGCGQEHEGRKRSCECRDRISPFHGVSKCQHHGSATLAQGRREGAAESTSNKDGAVAGRPSRSPGAIRLEPRTREES